MKIYVSALSYLPESHSDLLMLSLYIKSETFPPDELFVESIRGVTGVVLHKSNKGWRVVGGGLLIKGIMLAI